MCSSVEATTTTSVIQGSWGLSLSTGRCTGGRQGQSVPRRFSGSTDRGWQERLVKGRWLGLSWPAAVALVQLSCWPRMSWSLCEWRSASWPGPDPANTPHWPQVGPSWAATLGPSGLTQLGPGWFLLIGGSCIMGQRGILMGAQWCGSFSKIGPMFSPPVYHQMPS